MASKRPKSLFVLGLVFAWSSWISIDLLSRGSTSADRVLYDAVGLGWLAVALLTAIAALDLAAIRYLVKPAPVGRVVCLASIALSALQTSLGFAIARAHPDVARRAFTISRESRGLPIRPEAVDAAVDPTTTLLLLGGSLVLSAVWAYLVIKNTNYFVRRAGRPGGGVEWAA